MQITPSNQRKEKGSIILKYKDLPIIKHLSAPTRALYSSTIRSQNPLYDQE
jgi:hypothetical protein